MQRRSLSKFAAVLMWYPIAKDGSLPWVTDLEPPSADIGNEVSWNTNIYHAVARPTR
jgi:hypothetical protein